MEDILHRLRSFPLPPDTTQEAFETHTREFLNTMNELLPSVVNSSEKTRNILDLLDPSTHSLPYLLILHFHILEIRKNSHTATIDDFRPGKYLWSRMVLLIKTFDPAQIKYAASEWRNVVNMISKAAELANKPILAIRLFKYAIIRIDPTSAILTITHVYLVRMCLLARAYKSARQIIDQTIFSIPSAADQLYFQRSLDDSTKKIARYTYPFEFSANLTYADHLQYFLYSGMIYMSLKEWRKASHFLSIVISSPVVNAVSLIQVEAYKKWVLVNLLEKGTTTSLPRITSPLASKAYKALARPYDALSTAFISSKWERLRDEAKVGQSIWINDNNDGLVKQVLLSFRKQAVRSLGTTFAAVTTTDVTERALSNKMDVLETERYIVALAVQEDFSTSLVHPSRNSETSMLRFLTDHLEPSINVEVTLEEQLRSQHKKLELLVQNVQVSDRNLELSKEYVGHLRKAQKRSDATSKDTGGGGGRKREQNTDLDEDMMDELQ